MSDWRDAFRSERHPVYRRYRLGREARALWRFFYFVVAVILLSSIAHWLGLIS